MRLLSRDILLTLLTVVWVITNTDNLTDLLGQLINILFTASLGSIVVRKVDSYNRNNVVRNDAETLVIGSHVKISYDSRTETLNIF